MVGPDLLFWLMVSCVILKTLVNQLPIKKNVAKTVIHQPTKYIHLIAPCFHGCFDPWLGTKHHRHGCDPEMLGDHLTGRSAVHFVDDQR